jgi:hypothetical protein
LSKYINVKWASICTICQRRRIEVAWIKWLCKWRFST